MLECKPRWPMSRTVQIRAQLLDDMLAATQTNAHVAVGIGRGEAFIGARATCIACARSSDCRGWIDVHRVEYGNHAALDPPMFCPNTQFITMCRRAQAARGQPAMN